MIAYAYSAYHSRSTFLYLKSSEGDKKIKNLAATHAPGFYKSRNDNGSYLFNER